MLLRKYALVLLIAATAIDIGGPILSRWIEATIGTDPARVLMLAVVLTAVVGTLRMK
jgi:hypothetical protein